MENNKNKKSVKFQGDMLNFCDFIQVFVFTRNHHLKTSYFCYSPQCTMQNRGTCCLKRCFNTERSKGNFVRENLKKTASLMKMRSTLKVP